MKNKANNIKTGKLGEKLARKYIKKKLKYKVLEVNYRNIIGEIDIIAKDKNTIVFVEVKTKTSTAFGLPREQVTSTKQLKIKNTSLLYLKENSLQNSCIRFDVVDVLNKEITYITNAF